MTHQDDSAASGSGVIGRAPAGSDIWLSQLSSALLRDPLTAVTRERQKQLYIVAVTALLLQLGFLASSAEIVKVFGFELRCHDARVVIIGTVVLLVLLVALFALSAWRDLKMSQFLQQPAWFELRQFSHRETLRTINELERVVLELWVPPNSDSGIAAMATRVTAGSLDSDVEARFKLCHELLDLKTRARNAWFRLQHEDALAASAASMARVQEIIDEMDEGRVPKPKWHDPEIARLEAELQHTRDIEERITIHRRQNELMMAEIVTNERRRAEEEAKEDEEAERQARSLEADLRRMKYVGALSASVTDMLRSLKRDMVDATRRISTLTVLLEIAVPLVVGAVPIALFSYRLVMPAESLLRCG